MQRRHKILEPRLAWFVGLALVLVMTAALAVPQARAAIGDFLAGLPFVKVIAAEPGKDPGQQSSVTYNREPQAGETTYFDTTSLTKARSFLGVDVELPPSLEGLSMRVYREVEKNGELIMAGLSAPEPGFWARYRPNGDHSTQETYSSDWQVVTEDTTLGGRPARLVTAKGAKGNTQVEIWMVDGNWTYELRDDFGDMARLTKMAESMTE